MVVVIDAMECWRASFVVLGQGRVRVVRKWTASWAALMPNFDQQRASRGQAGWARHTRSVTRRAPTYAPLCSAVICCAHPHTNSLTAPVGADFAKFICRTPRVLFEDSTARKTPG